MFIFAPVADFLAFSRLGSHFVDQRRDVHRTNHIG
jgi:hypothetical protein